MDEAKSGTQNRPSPILHFRIRGVCSFYMVADSDTRMNQPSPIPGVIIGVAAYSDTRKSIGPGPILDSIQNSW